MENNTSYSSVFSDFTTEDNERRAIIQRTDELFKKQRSPKQSLGHKRVLNEEYDREEAKCSRYHFLSLNAYSRHKKMVNDYLVYYGGSVNDIKRDDSQDKTDLDVIRENQRFLWNESDELNASWDKRLAKRYWDKLFKVYCIADLTRYKENKIGMRWRIETEVVSGKGQFQCGNKKCSEREGMKSWEVNFGYEEHGEKRNALVKLRLCPDCSYMLNYHHKRKEAKAKKQQKKTKSKHSGKGKKAKAKSMRDSDIPDSDSNSEETATEDTTQPPSNSSAATDTTKDPSHIWKRPTQETDEKTREDEFDDYFQDMFL